jgi:Na+/H+ antiporter NhaC
MYKRKDNPTPPYWLSLIPLIVVGISLGFSVFAFDAQPHFASALGVPVVAYAPYAVLCWLTVVVAIIFGYSGIGMHKIPQNEEAEGRDQQ